MPISPLALELCGEPRKPEQLVFEDLLDTCGFPNGWSD